MYIHMYRHDNIHNNSLYIDSQIYTYIYVCMYFNI